MRSSSRNQVYYRQGFRSGCGALTKAGRCLDNDIGLFRSEFQPAMLKLTKKADYGLIALKHLAVNAPAQFERQGDRRNLRHSAAAAVEDPAEAGQKRAFCGPNMAPTAATNWLATRARSPRSK